MTLDLFSARKIQESQISKFFLALFFFLFIENFDTRLNISILNEASFIFLDDTKF